MIVGIGVDVVNVPKFDATMLRMPGFAEAVFTPEERVDEGGDQRTTSSLAARYAAKEALAKAMGAPPGMRWHDCQILAEPDGHPYVHTRGSIAEAAEALGVQAWHVSLAREGDVAIAYVVAEGSTTLAGTGPR